MKLQCVSPPCHLNMSFPYSKNICKATFVSMFTDMHSFSSSVPLQEYSAARHLFIWGIMWHIGNTVYWLSYVHVCPHACVWDRQHREPDIEKQPHSTTRDFIVEQIFSTAADSHGWLLLLGSNRKCYVLIIELERTVISPQKPAVRVISSIYSRVNAHTACCKSRFLLQKGQILFSCTFVGTALSLA